MAAHLCGKLSHPYFASALFICLSGTRYVNKYHREILSHVKKTFLFLWPIRAVLPQHTANEAGRQNKVGTFWKLVTWISKVLNKFNQTHTRGARFAWEVRQNANSPPRGDARWVRNSVVDSIKKHSYVKHDAANNVLLVCIINQDNSFLLYSFQARVRFVNSGKYTCKLQIFLFIILTTEWIRLSMNCQTRVVAADRET
ncbi:hypothetical protein P5673_008867 [Acropora cervicornis]|uniref:Uncharacterized protein n=1 Tax=Acropora cervicornis TaxID=6130 RepID=A0AAD9VAB1_ACRCE|nr:hypothetical protein P5673_008867 [Acropora cervicornis]